MPTLTRIADRQPTTDATRIVANLRPPRQFDDATFESYVPDAAHPSQATAVERMQDLAEIWRGGGRRGLFRKAPQVKPGIYLDGGFGVGKTHLLAALWKTMPGVKHFGTFIEYTALVGALGYQGAVRALSGATIVCIDEFELDDPGDTMVMTRLLGELVAGGAKIAATSNTPPNALGEGRFAAKDFLREIQAIADRFEIMRIDGDDYRQRDVSGEAPVVDDAALETALAERGESVALDDFDALVDHLASVHPSRYVDLVADLDAVGWRGVRTLTDQSQALRLVALVDRLYDAQVAIVASGTPLNHVFSEEMLGGGYRKKYLRATSRLIALTTGQA
ncbi:cell division protein ZapE [Agrococcus sp. SGAir0287]|uniref:cell division protein ZapE n=1 Tax=Agrococcus sp. SGAir0287 TaxID=2070347 RepID=UPI0010CCBBEB|nr:cell division protein ZapE [Agrococcus sp. SGAir0287]QCR19348.1 cell division protein ZapE [Agrococcus sp. SGAir0287]